MRWRCVCRKPSANDTVKPSADEPKVQDRVHVDDHENEEQPDRGETLTAEPREDGKREKKNGGPEVGSLG